MKRLFLGAENLCKKKYLGCTYLSQLSYIFKICIHHVCPFHTIQSLKAGIGFIASWYPPRGDVSAILFIRNGFYAEELD